MLKVLVMKENYLCELEKEGRSNTTFDSKILYFTSTGKTPWPFWSQLILYKTRWTTEISPEKAHKYYWLNCLYLTGNVIPFPQLEFPKSFRK